MSCGLPHGRGRRPGAPTRPRSDASRRRRTLAAGVIEDTPGNLAQWLANPQAVKQGCSCQFKLTPGQINDLVSYLETLQ